MIATIIAGEGNIARFGYQGCVYSLSLVIKRQLASG